MAAERVARRRVFFAVWPDAAAARRLDDLGREAHARCGGRRMRRDGLHMTLAFIGEVPVERLDELCAAAAGVAGEAFRLELDRIACWRHNRIVWAGCAQAPLPLLTLVGRLRARLAAAGLPLDERDFAAHLTLLRDARCEDLPAFDPIAWPVGEFVLAASRPEGGGNYDVIGRWALGARGQGLGARG